MDNKIILDWFNFADMDLDSAEYLSTMQRQPLEIICYHCQQSAEKFLKGFLIFNGIEEPPKIHNLVTLCDMCEKFDSCFTEIIKQCSVLTLYGVQPRYPNEIIVENSDMKKALEYANQIKNFAPLMEVRNVLEGS